MSRCTNTWQTGCSAHVRQLVSQNRIGAFSWCSRTTRILDRLVPRRTGYPQLKSGTHGHGPANSSDIVDAEQWSGIFYFRTTIWSDGQKFRNRGCRSCSYKIASDGLGRLAASCHACSAASTTSTLLTRKILQHGVGQHNRCSCISVHSVRSAGGPRRRAAIQSSGQHQACRAPVERLSRALRKDRA